MARVVVVGSSNTDLCMRLPHLPSRGQTVLGGPFWSGPGGKGANQAVAARRAGAEVVFLTAVGDDDFGRAALAGYRAEGIDVSYARVVPGEASGVALIFVDEGGENVIGVAPGANSLLTPDDIEALPSAIFEPSAILLASLEIPLETVERAILRAKRAGMTTILNPAPVDRLLNGRAEASERGHLLECVDILTPNESEALALAGSEGDVFAAASQLRTRLGVERVIVTRGSEGCLVVVGSETRSLPAYRVRAVDTVGAGDAFNGALATALAERKLLTEAVAWASAAGAVAVTRRGAQAALPTRQEIDQLASVAPPGRP